MSFVEVVVHPHGAPQSNYSCKSGLLWEFNSLRTAFAICYLVPDLSTNSPNNLLP